MSEVSLFLSGLSRFGEGKALLESLLSRASCELRSAQITEQCLLELFGVEPLPPESIPVAAFTRLADLPQGSTDTSGSSTVWMRVEPVHLRADLKRVFLFNSSHFTLDAEEAEELRDTLDEVFRARGLKLLGSARSDHWYLELEKLPDINTHTLSEVRGCDVLEFLPSGEESRWWRTLHNEVQMTLHESPLNQRRERVGEMPINAVWFWGQGSLPALPERRWDRVCARDSLSQGLALHSRADYVSTADGIGRLDALLKDTQRLLIVNPVATDLEGLEQDWLSPLLTALRRGRVKRLNIISEDAKFSLTRASLACIWRRRKPLSTLFGIDQSRGG